MRAFLFAVDRGWVRRSGRQLRLAQSFRGPSNSWLESGQSSSANIRYSRIANFRLRFRPKDLKPQDLLVLRKVAAHPPQRWDYTALGEALAMSASETHASVKRAAASGLAVAPSSGEWPPVRPNLLESVLHSVRYIPCSKGPG
jgi:hypothetical protein